MRPLINSKLKATPKTQNKGSSFSLIIERRQSLKEKPIYKKNEIP